MEYVLFLGIKKRNIKNKPDFGSTLIFKSAMLTKDLLVIN